MDSPDEKANILLVDDRPDKLLALEAVIADLGQNVVKANSGKDALRCLMQQDFAVILLDVNMPVMDGFETAMLIRQRKSSEHTPIIFVTAFNDNENHMSRGYSLGAVDYILAPVVPEVLRGKISAFVNLYKMNVQIRRQAESLGEQAERIRLQAESLAQRNQQLHKLTEASLAINSELSIENMLKRVTDAARDITGAAQASACATDGPHHDVCVSGANMPADLKNCGAEAFSDGIFRHACRENKVVRLDQQALENHPSWQKSLPIVRQCLSRGCVISPLTGRDGHNMGFIALSDKSTGEFTLEDEAILTQLAQMVSIAIENTLNLEAREANRVKDEFLATLSHELRTPLTAMLGWVRMLQMGSLDAVASQHGLAVIERNVKAQARLIEDLLDVSRIVTGKLRLNVKPLEIATVVQAAAESLAPAATAKNIQVHMDMEPEIGGVQVSGDPDRLQQVMWNLLSNAIKFTPGGGMIHIHGGIHGSDVVLQLTDTGKGISPEFLPHVFDRFRQADSSSTREYGGLGLGLAIVRSIIELHGGKVAVESKGEGMGSRFTITLPCKTSTLSKTQKLRVARADNGNNEPAAASLEGFRVLVVDDEPDTRELICEVLKMHAAEVRSAGSAREALECMKTSMPDILISDIGMPDMDGYGLIRHLRSLGTSIPAVALTAYARDEDKARALSAGYQTHVSKPIDPLVLVEVVASTANVQT